MLGVDYSPPSVPDGVTLQGDQKLWDSQLRDIQYQAGQTIKWLDYYMHTRLNNLFKFAHISCKAPPISPASAPQLIDPAIMRDTLAIAEATKKNWRSPQSDVRFRQGKRVM
ncbi:hypothetical protein BG000_006591, partial [Podila horticola]